MKEHTMIMIALVAISAYAGMMAQSPAAADASSKSRMYDCKADHGLSNLLVALRSENQGLVESAMMRVAEVKIFCPGSDIAKTKDIIDSLSVHANVPSLRYKAYLASNVCDNPVWFAKVDNIKSEEKFFDIVAAQLQERIFGSRTDY
jgi:hypothetical protein